MILAALALATAGPIEAERAFAAMAQTEGQWTSFRSFADANGIMFVPKQVNAQQWLAGRKDPPVGVMWWPGRSWISCDGSLAVNTGPWVRDGGRSLGYFTTIWQRQKDGSWKWLLDHGDVLSKPMVAGDVVRPQRASCASKRPHPGGVTVMAMEHPGEGRAADDSLRWSWAVQPDGSRRVAASIWNGKTYDTVLDNRVPAP